MSRGLRSPVRPTRRYQVRFAGNLPRAVPLAVPLADAVKQLEVEPRLVAAVLHPVAAGLEQSVDIQQLHNP